MSFAIFVPAIKSFVLLHVLTDFSFWAVSSGGQFKVSSMTPRSVVVLGFRWVTGASIMLQQVADGDVRGDEGVSTEAVVISLAIFCALINF